MEHSTLHVESFNGIQVLVPNRVFKTRTHVISYNNRDIGIYGCATTAVILPCQYGTKKHYDDCYLILRGNHVEALKPLDLVETLEYISKNIHLKALYSEDVSDYLNYRPLSQR